MNKNRLPLLLPIRSFIFVLVFVIGALVVHKNVSEISNWWSIIAVIVNILNILLLVYAARRNGQTYWELVNYQKGKTHVGQVLLVSLMILTVGTAGMYLAGYLCYGILPYGAPMMIAPIPKTLAIINLILLPVTTAFAEDGLYLGCGINQIKNKTAAILVPAFFFALQHCFIPTLFEAPYILYRFLSFLPLTISPELMWKRGIIIALLCVGTLALEYISAKRLLKSCDDIIDRLQMKEDDLK